MDSIKGDEAFVTLSTNDNYCLGALVLAHSLRNVGTTRKLVILVTPSVSSDMRKCLSKAYDLVQQVDVMHSNEHKILEVMKRPELGVTLTKLHCWRLTQFKKCIFMDADTLPLKNIDELFQREELSAVCDIGWPDCFNTGLFVFRPSETTFAQLCALAVECGSFDGGDQGLLNTYFSDWSTSDISKHLSFIYNMSSVSTYSYPAAYQRFGDTVKVVHFLGALKPWMYGFNALTRKVIPPSIGSQTQQLEHVQKWWDVFINQVQPYLSSDCAGIFTINGASPSNESQPLVQQDNNELNVDDDNDENITISEDNINDLKESEVIVTNKTIKDNTDNRNELDYVDATTSPTSDDINLLITPTNLTSNTESTINEHDDKFEIIDDKMKNDLDNKLLDKRFKAWEKGSMDYMGLDSFDNIQRKLNQAIGLSNLPHVIKTIKQSANQSSTKLSKLSTPCNSLDLSAGLAAQLAKLRLDSTTDSHYPGIIGSSAHIDDYSRKRAWEAGSVDYLGVDSFENIQKKLDQAIGENPYFLAAEESFEETVVVSDEQPPPPPTPQQQSSVEIPSPSTSEQPQPQQSTE